MMRYLVVIGIFLIVFGYSACKEVDDLPPIITLKGDTLINHVLNTEYIDPGATATDETDGNLTSNIYVENNVNVNRIGNYKVTYKVVDDAGNEAAPVFRTVRVINLGWIFMGTYNLTETQSYPEQGICSYEMVVRADSTINYRIVINDFACQTGQNIFADILDTVIVIPYQVLADSLQTLTLQGSGFINDTLISVEYSRKQDNISSLWNAEFKRL